MHLTPSDVEKLLLAAAGMVARDRLERGVRSRIRETTIAAEDSVHDLGALSATSSDAQAMGRIGEVITRT